MMKMVVVLMIKKEGLGYPLYSYDWKDSTLQYVLCIVVSG
jgi:hypothetical protein